jgi:2-methylisocitrate lyase-like PEP mutase family enzyme
VIGEHSRVAAELLRRLHRGPRPLLLVNVWDVASALVIERADFPAIATSSSAIATSLGYPDGEVISATEMLDVVGRIASRLQVPLTADMEAGYGGSAEAVSQLASRLIEVGAVGLNLEDGTDPDGRLVDPEAAVANIEAVREAGASLGVPLVINARTDAFLVLTDDPREALSEALSRLARYRDAGADCLFPIGARDAATIKVLVAELGFPINILAGPGAPTIGELEDLGVARVSLGGGPHRAALATLERIAEELRYAGAYDSLVGALTHADLDELVSRSWR